MDNALQDTVELLSTRLAAAEIGVDLRALPRLAEETGISAFGLVVGQRTSRKKRRKWATRVWDPAAVKWLAAYVRARGGVR